MMRVLICPYILLALNAMIPKCIIELTTYIIIYTIVMYSLVCFIDWFVLVL